MKLDIRRAYPVERWILCALDKIIFSEEDAFSNIDDWIGLETFFILVNNYIVGSIALKSDADVASSWNKEGPKCPGTLYIISTAVAPNWQGQGIGDFAKKWEIEYAKIHNFQRIVTNARASNVKSIRLNQKYGFKIIKTMPNYYGDEDSLVLELKL